MSGLSAAFGARARQLENRTWFQALLSNPIMSDGVPLFDAAHGNLATPAALDVPSLAAARQLMRSQKDPQGNTLNLTPRFLLVGPAQEVAAEQTLFPKGVVYTNPADMLPESLRSLSLVVSDEISGPEWFLLADPRRGVDTMEHAHLNVTAAGVARGPGPDVTARADFDTLALSVRAVLDFAAAPIDWVAMVKNLGA